MVWSKHQGQEPSGGEKVQSPRMIGRARRHAIYDCVCCYATAHNGATPSIREVSQILELDYNTTYYHVDKLIVEGLLRKEDGKIVVIGARLQLPTGVHIR